MIWRMDCIIKDELLALVGKNFISVNNNNFDI